MKEVTNMMNTEEIAKRFLTEMKKNERTVTCKGVVVEGKRRQREISWDEDDKRWGAYTYSEEGAENMSECYPVFSVISEDEVMENLVRGSPQWGRKVFMNF